MRVMDLVKVVKQRFMLMVKLLLKDMLIKHNHIFSQLMRQLMWGSTTRRRLLRVSASVAMRRGLQAASKQWSSR